jgi:hypothetical protein
MFESWSEAVSFFLCPLYTYITNVFYTAHIQAGSVDHYDCLALRVSTLDCMRVSIHYGIEMKYLDQSFLDRVGSNLRCLGS